MRKILFGLCVVVFMNGCGGGAPTSTEQENEELLVDGTAVGAETSDRCADCKNYGKGCVIAKGDNQAGATCTADGKLDLNKPYNEKWLGFCLASYEACMGPCSKPNPDICAN